MWHIQANGVLVVNPAWSLCRGSSAHPRECSVNIGSQATFLAGYTLYTYPNGTGTYTLRTYASVLHRYGILLIIQIADITIHWYQ